MQRWQSMEFLKKELQNRYLVSYAYNGVMSAAILNCPKCGKPRTRRIDRPNQFHCLPCERIRVNAYLKTARGKAAQKHANKRYYALVSQLGTAHSGRNNKLFQSVARLYLDDGATVADVTYGQGHFWRNVDIIRPAFNS